MVVRVFAVPNPRGHFRNCIQLNDSEDWGKGHQLILFGFSGRWVILRHAALLTGCTR